MALALLASPPPPLGGFRRSFGTKCSLFAAHRAKRNLMDLISDQDRGLRTQKDAVKRDAIVNAIEAMAVIGGSSVTTGDSLSATWRLLWTTEKEQLFIIEKAGLFGTRAGEVLQVIDVRKGTLNNVITFPPVIDPSQSTTLSTSLQTCTRLKTFSYKKVVFFFSWIKECYQRV